MLLLNRIRGEQEQVLLAIGRGPLVEHYNAAEVRQGNEHTFVLPPQRPPYREVFLVGGTFEHNSRPSDPQLWKQDGHPQLPTELPYEDGPLWVCAYCNEGTVMLSLSNLSMMETALTTSGRLSEDTWDPELASERFTLIATCDHCDDPTLLSGERVTRWVPEEDPLESWRTYLVPKYVSPPPRIVRRPKGISAQLDGELTRVESLFWTDQDFAFEVVRDLIEDILSEGITRVIVESATEWITKTTDRRTRTMADLLDGIALLDELLVQL
jgi:hypothetical protein